MKSLLIALGMAAVLFIYGYIFSTVGRDHARHAEGVEDRQEAVLEGNTKALDHEGHDHSHH